MAIGGEEQDRKFIAGHGVFPVLGNMDGRLVPPD
jgi:hypothetical protein